MNKLFTIAFSLFAAVAFGDVIGIPDGGTAAVRAGGRVARVEVLSSVAAGTATVKRIQTLETNATEITVQSFTNVTYMLVYSNGTETVTNVTLRDQSAYLSGLDYISYWTNRTVRTVAETNTVPALALTATNAVGSQVTCSGGVGGATVSDAWVTAGDLLFFEGTAKGRVTVFIER